MKLVQPWTLKPFALILSWVVRAWIGTLEFHFAYDDAAAIPRKKKSRGIYLFWHEMMLYPAYLHGRQDFAVLVSQHRDGELIMRILRMLNIDAIRGSTRRRGAGGVRKMMRAISHHHIAITPDGPQGPRRVVQPGAIYLASRTGLPIWPVAYAPRSAWQAGSWDRMSLPKPWTKVWCLAGPAIMVPQDLPMERIEEFRVKVQAAMNDVQRRVDLLMARKDRTTRTFSLAQVTKKFREA